MEPNRRHLHLSEEGFGLLGTMITVGVVVTMVGLLLTYLSDAFVYEAKMRVNSLEKKSFGGAEQTLINQRPFRICGPRRKSLRRNPQHYRHDLAQSTQNLLL